MEHAMPDRENQLSNYPTVDFVINAIANWVSRYREATGYANELGQCSPEDVSQIARDLGVSSIELRELANKGPHAADLVQKMLVALHVDPKVIADTDPLVMRDLQRLCINCGDKKRCERELAAGTAAEHFHEFCPNALTLDALFEQKNQPAQH
jgi:ribosomal protein S14